MTKKFYQETPAGRLDRLALKASLQTFYQERQSTEMPELIENYIADFKLPEGVLPSLILDGQSFSVPMVTEEPSVVAAASNGARLVGLADGFQGKGKSQALLGGEILFLDVDQAVLATFIKDKEERLIEVAKQAKPSMAARGDGLKALAFEVLDDRHSKLAITVQTGLAMGANAVNTILEALKKELEDFAPFIVGAILTNSGQDALVSVEAGVPIEALGGLRAAEKIVALSDFGKVDADRAVTENKGIFNGLSAVVLATGNDYRAVEAAGHAYAARTGRYQSLSEWRLSADRKQLLGRLTMPLNIGLLGGAIAALPMAQRNLELLGNPDLDTLKKVVLATGLANNLAALKAVAGPGIQAGHMRMQARTLAIQAGAVAGEIVLVAEQLSKKNRIDQHEAEKILGELRSHDA
ncbi:hydroxymethylglutaryl-CoA reductase [Fructobacillus papyrifericola]|uniref:Hydroxymethylglutaryl-CoA reductase n=1 Tax=Fructobacillus papyrifericola TaxID=2713172 RepID=A0ABS5QUD0_9LACO|nr:hydroxymethylglutaryl-CoA reductase [Fructobacillus papyrifericola]MBS9336547.1 hydroxymethylglutaryl-CoA reductase [Fructobacillus papyrifericola]